MPDAHELLAAIHRDPAFGPQTLARGRAYALGRRVRRLQVVQSSAAVVVSALVDGTFAYKTSATLTPYGSVFRLHNACTCPLDGHCKHVVAMAVAAAEQHPRGGAWRQVLDQVLDEAEGTRAQAPANPERVAVQLVVPRKASARRWRPSTDLGVGLSIGVRAVRLGTSGRWVSTKMGWRDLMPRPYAPAGAVLLDPADQEVLTDLGHALVNDRNYYLSNQPVDLSLSGSTLWRSLGAAVAADLPLVCSDPAIAVRLASGAALQVDVVDAGSDVAVTPGLTVDGAWTAGSGLALVGEPPHGVVTWEGRPMAAGSTLVLAPLDAPLPPPVRRWLEGEPLVVDRSGVEELTREYLPRLARSITLGSRDGSVALPGAPTIRLHGDVTWHEDGRVELSWRWTYRQDDAEHQYPVRPPDVGDARPGSRDRAAETALLERLGPSAELADLLSVGTAGPGTLADHVVLRDVEAMRFAAEHLPWLRGRPEVELVTNDEPPDFRSVTGVPQVRFVERGEAERRDRTDWLELEVVVSVDDDKLGPITLDLPRVLAALISGDTQILVHRGVFVDVDRPELDRLRRLVHDARQLVDQPPRGLRLARGAHELLADLLEVGPTEGRLAEWAAASSALRELAASGSTPEPAPLPAGLRAELRPYQHDGFQWLDFLRRHRLGGVLADDMGLGKTVQTLAMIGSDREAHPDGTDRRPFLVVAPSSVVATWVSEAARFTPGLSVVAVTESAGRRGWHLAPDHPAAGADIVVTTYTLVRLEADQYASLRWAGLVLDEAQAVKNHQGKTHGALRRLEADCRFAITGTPIENNLMELWSLLTLCAPGLFPHADKFRTEVALPVQQHADPEVLADLRRRIRPVLLRRTKELVAADLPPRQEQVVPVELSARHRRIYDVQLQRERQRVLRLLDDLDENRITILASLTRLRQLSLDPALVDAAHEQVGSAKIDELVQRLTEVAAEGHRALVFSQFTGFLARVRTRLDAVGITYAYLDGRTRGRPAVIDGFRTGSAPAFLISLKAGGVGLTLTEADYCFLLDPWWNPAVEAQAVGRAHRIGQQRPVLVYRLVSEGTIEEKVIELAARKADLYASVLDADGELSQSLTAADIASLLG